MKSISMLTAIFLLLSFGACDAQIKNAKTESVKVYGNCGMCKSTIEKAGNLKGLVKVMWAKDTKIATLTYNANKTNQDEILKRIALAGYDSDKFLAPDDVYAKLPECCLYERKAKTVAKQEPTEPKNPTTNVEKPKEQTPNVSQMKVVFDHYFAIKDALVASDGALASSHAKALISVIDAIQMDKLSQNEHTILMKVKKELAFDAEHINETKDAGHQRDHFITLSQSVYELIKASKQDAPIYYQRCPMANDGKGATWLSKENAIKNPYYGSKMLTCGKTVETIK